MKSIRERLQDLHDQEHTFNVDMGRIDNEIKALLKKKAKLAKRVSNNMKYRNQLINRLTQ